MMVNSNKSFPCYQCTDRTVGCHSTCQAYIKEKERIDADREKRHSEAEKEAVIDSYRKKVITTMKKRRSTGNWKRG